jgi:hypothetical protein
MQDESKEKVAGSGENRQREASEVLRAGGGDADLTPESERERAASGPEDARSAGSASGASSQEGAEPIRNSGADVESFGRNPGEAIGDRDTGFPIHIGTSTSSGLEPEDGTGSLDGSGYGNVIGTGHAPATGGTAPDLAVYPLPGETEEEFSEGNEVDGNASESSGDDA